MNIAEPDVTLTDYGLAVECAVFAVLLYRMRAGAGATARWFVVFFGALAAAALAGGSVHGFFPDPQSAVHRVLWDLTLLSIGLVALSAWFIGSRFRFARRFGHWLRPAATMVFVIYCLVVLFVRNDFVVAIVHYLPAVLFLLIAFAAAYVHSRRRYLLTGLAGLLLTLVAAAVQVMGIALHPVYFNHNALYHLIQAVAVFLLFLCARGIVRYGESP